jgi:putative PEP-CTERM system histidine kinase
MTLSTFHLLCQLLGVLAYVALTIFCIVTWARRITGRAAFAASLSTLLFMVSQLVTGVSPISLTFQSVALVSWMMLLARVVGIGPGNALQADLRPVTRVVGVGVLLAGFVAVYAWLLAMAGTEVSWLDPAALFVADLLFAISGLVLLEQVVRNTRDDLRWRLRYLNIGIGTLFAFQLVHNATALLFNGYMLALIAVQPAVFALAAPFIAVASLRNPRNPLRLNLSRQFVFRSGVLLATGAFLLALGALGYVVRLLDGDWVGAVLALLAVVVGVSAVTVFGAPRVRTRIRLMIEEHLYPRKHDYRDAWLRVTKQLTEPSPDFDLTQQTVRALGSVLHAHGGAVWRLTPQGSLVHIGQLHTDWRRPLAPATSRHLQRFFETHDWILDLNALPEPAQHLACECPDLFQLGGLRFVVPLMSDSGLFGIAGLTESTVPLQPTWEDYDVLKLIARQAAGFVGLQEAERRLAEADKLSSYNQVSAFVVHDVKTISAQLSLLLENAEKHKQNPAFVDDMLSTVANAVHRMQKLMEQFRGTDQSNRERIDLQECLTELLATFKGRKLVPELHVASESMVVTADCGKVQSALGHLIDNAIDAANAANGQTGREPQVSVRLEEHPPWAEVVIEDNGPGMDQAFIDGALFQPFTSTKGVAGMGVGAYQARAYVRSVGGDISVRSRPGRGTTFTVRLPLGDEHERP